MRGGWPAPGHGGWDLGRAAWWGFSGTSRMPFLPPARSGPGVALVRAARECAGVLTGRLARCGGCSRWSCCGLRPALVWPGARLRLGVTRLGLATACSICLPSGRAGWWQYRSRGGSPIYGAGYMRPSTTMSCLSRVSVSSVYRGTPSALGRRWILGAGQCSWRSPLDPSGNMWSQAVHAARRAWRAGTRRPGVMGGSRPDRRLQPADNDECAVVDERARDDIQQPHPLELVRVKWLLPPAAPLYDEWAEAVDVSDEFRC